MSDDIRVLVVENQELFRIGIRSVLSGETDVRLVGEADNGSRGFELFDELKPDVVILSLRMPDSCAIDRLADYFRADATARIVILAEHAGDAEIKKSLKRGALGYVCKDVAPAELVQAVRTVAAGRKFIPGRVASILSEHIGTEEMTRTESRVLQMIVGGMSNKEIAFALDITANTVKTHVKNIFDKLGVSDRTSAATTAIRRGLVRVDFNQQL
ncbi:MAG TPA: response regulator transcription factor [Pyrinomonadaceae bacterium]|nr:response regulator transcription factor [Pyrinomonadaceae bacterium]